jgi:ubiquinone biosynthesis protein COQ4
VHFFSERPLPSLKIHDVITEMKGVFGMLRNPEHTDSVFDIEDGLRHSEATKLSMDYILSCPEMGPMVRERYLRAKVPDLDALRKLPEGTLGRTYADNLIHHGFDPDYFRKVEVIDDDSYLILRIRETHDLWHVMTGFLPNRIGEIGLKAVEVAQLRRPMAAIICCGGVMRYMLRDPDGLEIVIEAISKGYQLGLGAKKLLAQKWEERWEERVDDLREELGVQPVTREASGLG